MKYVTVLNGEQYEVEISNDGQIFINGEPREVDFLNLGGALYSVITEGQSLEAVIDDEDDKIAVMMGGRLYETQVLDERALLMAQRRGGLGNDTGEVHAPMPGLIVKVVVQEGQAIEAGQTVVILESMKMQNELKAPITGTVGRVHIEASQTVDKNTLLLEIDAPKSEEDE